MSRAPTISYSFSISIRRRTGFPRRLRSTPRSVFAPIQLKPISPGADYLFGVSRLRSPSGRTCHRAAGSAEQQAVFYSLRLHQSPPQPFYTKPSATSPPPFALDPRNPNAYNLLADTYVLQRRFLKRSTFTDNVLAAGEQYANRPVPARLIHLVGGTGDTGPLREILTKYPDMEFAGGQTPVRAWMAMLDGNYAEAERLLAASPRQDFQDIDFSFYYPKSVVPSDDCARERRFGACNGCVSRSREILAQRLIVKPEHARTIAVLAQVDAGLGQKELALQEAQHAIDLMPISKDIYDGALVLEGLAQVYTWSGEHDRAIELLQKLVSIPSYINYGRLKFHPLVGSAPRRSAFREDRQLTRAERSEQVNSCDESEDILRRAEAAQRVQGGGRVCRRRLAFDSGRNAGFSVPGNSELDHSACYSSTAFGFPVALIIAWAFELTPEGIKRTEVADAAQQHSRGGVWIAVVLVAAALSLGFFFLGRYTAGTATPRLSETATASNLQKSIAVLPLVNTSGDPSNEYFSDGLSEELIAVLAKIPDLKVIGRSSSFFFKGKSDDSASDRRKTRCRQPDRRQRAQAG